MRIEYTNGYYDGEVNYNDERHGRGTLVVDGDRYIGEWRNDEPYGRGKYTWSDGTWYDGDWKGWDRSGHGTMHYTDGVYVGEWENDKRNGQGTFKSNEGWSYAGSYKNDEMHGHGKYTGDDWYYEGEFRNGDFNGYGTKRFTDGNYYTGYFLNDQFHGKGTWYQEHGAVSFEGNWIDDENATEVIKTDHGKKSHGKMVNDSFEEDPLNGYAREDYSNGYYEGIFSHGKRHGKGIYYWNDGEKYDGDWYYGDRHGKGIMYYNNGNVYDGKWNHDEWDGYGVLRGPNGCNYQGYFTKGVYRGEGIFTDENGYCFESDKWTSCGNADPVTLFGNGMTPEKGKLVEWKFIPQKQGTERFTQTYKTKDGGEVQVTYAKRYLDNGNTELMIDKIYSTGQTFHQTHHESGMTNIEVSFEGKTFHVLLNPDGTLHKYYEK